MRKNYALICAALMAICASCGTKTPAEPVFTGYLFAHMTNEHYGRLWSSEDLVTEEEYRAIAGNF